MKTRTAAWLAWSLLALAFIFFVVGLGLFTLTPENARATLSSSAPEISFSLSMLVYMAIGALIAARRPENPIGWVFCAIGFTWDIRFLVVQSVVYLSGTAPSSLNMLEPVIWLPINLWVVSFNLVALLFLLFPTGKLMGRGWSVVVGLIFISTMSGLFSSYADLQVGPITLHFYNPLLGEETGSGLQNWLQILSQVLLMLTYLAGAASLVIRFRRAKGDERQQLKWFAYASALLAVTLFALYLPKLLPASTGVILNASYPAAIFLGIPFALALTAVPVAVGIAIFKYRLYDIDLIIRRTLIYSIITAMLVLFYFGSVAVLQNLLSAVSGQRSEIAIIVSTLAIAALFNPLRHRVQNAIDNRFYRRKYDAQQALAHFAQTARDEVELEKLTAELVNVVSETMQPTSVSLWLKKESKQLKARQ